MRRTTGLVAGAVIALASTGAHAFDRDGRDSFGWGARYNAHLSEYDGRPLGPPLPALPPGYQYYNGKLIRVPYYDPAHVGTIYVRPRHVARPSRAARARSAHRRH